jgi:hypothetical protein
MSNTFNDFLKYTSSQKEVSLAIAKDDAELSELVQTLEGQEFRQAVDTSDLFKQITQPGKVFFVVKEALPKDMYDFVVQYPTGQIEIYDKFNLKSQTVTPSYKDVAVIFVITKGALTKTQESGFRILEQVGITYQS